MDGLGATTLRVPVPSDTLFRPTATFAEENPSSRAAARLVVVHIWARGPAVRGRVRRVGVAMMPPERSGVTPLVSQVRPPSALIFPRVAARGFYSLSPRSSSEDRRRPTTVASDVDPLVRAFLRSPLCRASPRVLPDDPSSPFPDFFSSSWTSRTRARRARAWVAAPRSWAPTPPPPSIQTPRVLTCTSASSPSSATHPAARSSPSAAGAPTRPRAPPACPFRPPPSPSRSRRSSTPARTPATSAVDAAPPSSSTRARRRGRAPFERSSSSTPHATARSASSATSRMSTRTSYRARRRRPWRKISAWFPRWCPPATRRRRFERRIVPPRARRLLSIARDSWTFASLLGTS